MWCWRRHDAERRRSRGPSGFIAHLLFPLPGGAGDNCRDLRWVPFVTPLPIAEFRYSATGVGYHPHHRQDDRPFLVFRRCGSALVFGHLEVWARLSLGLGREMASARVM